MDTNATSGQDVADVIEIRDPAVDVNALMATVRRMSPAGGPRVLIAKTWTRLPPRFLPACWRHSPCPLPLPKEVAS